MRETTASSASSSTARRAAASTARCAHRHPATGRADEDLQTLGIKRSLSGGAGPVEVRGIAYLSAHANCSRISGTRSRSTRPKLRPSIFIAGDSAHSPRQRTVRSVKRPAWSVSPAPTPSRCSSRSSRALEPRAWHDVPAQDFDDVAAHRLQVKSVVEAGHPQYLRQPHLPQAGQVLQCPARNVAVGLVDFLEDRHHRPRIAFMPGEDVAEHGRVRFIERHTGLEGRRTLRRAADGTDGPAIAAAGAFIGADTAGPLADPDTEAARLPIQSQHVGHRQHVDIVVPHALDQLGRNDARGTVAGGKGLIEPRHAPADGRALLDKVYAEPGRGKVQGGLDPRNASTADQRGPARLVAAG